MNDLRYSRNSIKYYGKRFDREYAEKVMDFMEHLYPLLKRVLEEGEEIPEDNSQLP